MSAVVPPAPSLPAGRRTRRAVLGGGAALAVLGGGVAGRRAWLDRDPDALPITDQNGNLLWSNWAGTEHSYPVRRAAPASEDELVSILRSGQGPLRPVGAGHSFTGLATTNDMLLTLDRLTGLVAHDPIRHQATVRAGTRLYQLGPALSVVGQEMPNLPDVNKQSLGGGLATGTHGTGNGLKAMHGEVTALRVATPAGDLVDCDAKSRPELFHAARVGLGAFGVVTQVTLQNAPLKRVRKRSEVRGIEDLLDDWPRLRTAHRNVEFFILPFTGHALLITHDETDDPLKPRTADDEGEALLDLKRLRDWFEFAPTLRRALSRAALKDAPFEEFVDEGWRLLSNERTVRFREIEYHLPIEAQVSVLREVLTAIEAHHREVFFPIEARIIASDDAWLSPFYGRESGSVAVHAYHKDDHDFFYTLIEPILRRHGGRPHWGKLHSLRAADFAGLYPRWKDAVELRRDLDPAGRLLNPHLRTVFGA